MIQIQSVLHVTAPWLGQAGLSLTTIQIIEGDPFFRALKSDNATHKLITGIARGDKNLISKTTIFDDLAELRNKKRQRLLEELKPQAADDDLGLEGHNDVEKFAHLLPQVIVVSTPAVGEIASIDMRVSCEKKGAPLTFMLTADALRYLHDVVMLSANVHDKKTDRIDRTVKFAPYYAKSRKAFRVRYTDEDGSHKTKDFKPSDDSPEAMALAEQAAADFHASHA